MDDPFRRRRVRDRLDLTAGAAQAGPCSDEIGRIEMAMKQPGFQPSGTQTAVAEMKLLLGM